MWAAVAAGRGVRGADSPGLGSGHWEGVCHRHWHPGGDQGSSGSKPGPPLLEDHLLLPGQRRVGVWRRPNNEQAGHRVPPPCPALPTVGTLPE